MEGRYETVSRRMLDRLNEDSQSYAIQAIGTGERLPTYQRSAEFSSSEISEANADRWSALTAVWFSDGIPDSIAELFVQLTARIDSARFAREFDPFDF